MSNTNARRRGWMLVLLLAVPASLMFAVTTGSVAFRFIDLWQALTNNDAGIARTVVFELRLPRALAAFAVGGMLALAGALLQVLLRNPLADPYVLGVSGGAAVGALLAILFGFSTILIGGSAFGGALLTMILVFQLSRAGGTWTSSRLLLTGVVMAAGWGACIGLLLALAPETQLQGMLFWLLGDLSNVQYPRVGLTVLVVGLIVALLRARALNVLARGEQVAAALGEDPTNLRILIYFLAAALTAAAVTLAGSIGFVGLIVPHLIRLLGGVDHRFLLMQSALLGGSFLVVADTLARSIFAPVQLPVGVLTAILGVPIFLYLLTRAQSASGRLG